MVNLLLAGVEDDGTPSLYFMDYLASMVKVCWNVVIFGYKSLISQKFSNLKAYKELYNYYCS